MKKVLFLYTELSGYFQSCIEELSFYVDEIHIVHWPVSKEAPFKLNFSNKIFLHKRSNYLTNSNLNKLAKSINPQIIVSSGWMDKGYLNVCYSFRGSIPIVMSMDNHWFGTFKQRFACFISPFLLKKIFSHIWVPGKPQMEYANKLGFKENQILEGFYSADIKLYSERFEKIIDNDGFVFPKRFLFIGRYVEQKGLNILFDAFLELQEEFPNEWELWCVGTGPLWDNKPINKKIVHFGFLQPQEILELLKDVGIFILPSVFEPWGVVIHEMTAAGFPVISSSKVGASTRFVKNNVNGWIFESGDKEQLKNILYKVIHSSEQELVRFSKISFNLGHTWSPKLWSKILVNLL